MMKFKKAVADHIFVMKKHIRCFKGQGINFFNNTLHQDIPGYTKVQYMYDRHEINFANV